MNYNSNYINYQTPSTYGNGTPQYGYDGQTGQQQNAYSNPPAPPPPPPPPHAPSHPTAPPNGQYGQYHPPAHNFSTNQYAHSQPSPQSYPQAMVVIPQRNYSSQLPHSQPLPPQHQHQHQNQHQQRSQPGVYATPQSIQHHQQQQQNHWYAQQRQAQPQVVQYQQPYATPQYPLQSPNVAARPVKAMVEIPVARHQQKTPQRQPSGHSIPSQTGQDHVANVKVQVPPRPADLPVDYQLLLLSLAEEYIDAAYGMGPMVALYRRVEEMEMYNQLIATGLSCMETVLKKFRLQPRQEAWLTLQYASLMYAETQSYAHLEAVLSKGIALCDRNKLLDLKYSMHHLFARVLFGTKPKAALRSLDILIPDVEAYKHVPWIYALRFLRVSLSLQMGDSHHEHTNAIHHLRAISVLAEERSDYAIYVTCATIEAMVHLRAGTPDSLEQVQRTIASARSLQLQPSLKDLSQVWTLLTLIDVSYSLVLYAPEQASTNVTALQERVDELLTESSWADDGSFAVPMEGPTGHLTDSTNGIFQHDANGKDCIVFSWLNKRDLYILSYLLSGAVSQLKNTVDHKTENYINEGLKMVTDNFDAKNLTQSSIAPISASLVTAAHRLQWWTQIQWHLHLFFAFIRCNHNNWNGARSHLKILLETCQNSDVRDTLRRKRWTTYLTGIIEQGTGNIAGALSSFLHPILALPTANPNRSSDSHDDLCLLAALNTLLIIRAPSHPQHHLAESITAALEPLTLNHPNKSIVSAIYLLKSVLNPNDTITSRKQSLQSALNNARSVNNSQLLAVAMNVMTSLFFKGIVGEQAQKSTNTAHILAKRAGNGLWGAVATGMMADTMERLGNGQAAEKIRNEADRYVESLPREVKATFTLPE